MKHEHKVEIRDDGIAYAYIVGDGDTEDAGVFVKDAMAVFAEDPREKYNSIVNMLDSGTSNFGGIKVYRDFIKSAPLNKVAFVIKDKIIKALIGITMEGKKDDVEYFETLEKAEEWIKQFEN